jgi:hypothetical protein
MDSRELLLDCFGRVDDYFRSVADGLDARALNFRPGGSGNSISWLLWHLTRVQDDHIAGLTADLADGHPQEAQAWSSWRERFGLPLEDWDTGYGHVEAQVATVRVEDADLLLGYHADVHRLTLDRVGSIASSDLQRIVDRRWDPPVTAGVRLISIVGDCVAHLGQADYVKGLAPTG